MARFARTPRNMIIIVFSLLLALACLTCLAAWLFFDVGEAKDPFLVLVGYVVGILAGLLGLEV